MVRSVLEYYAPAWDPYLEGDKNNLEKILRHAAHVVCSDYRLMSSVTSMLKVSWVGNHLRRGDGS